MFNGYNETPLISYNEYNQERLEKKQENVAKWSYGHDAGIQPAQTHPNSRHSEFWPGRANFLGVGNVVKCNCAGCYPSTENQSYQGDSTRHRPWLPRTFPVPLNGSNESCKLPTYQWDSGTPNQGACYSENNLPYVQENGGKYPYYRSYQSTRLPEPNQPGVITSVKEAEFGKKGKNEMTSRGQESPIQNGALCNLGYNLTKRPDGRNYCEPNDKHSNVASYSVDQHLARLPVVEPFIKAVPSNLSQNRVPSTGYRSVKDNMAQPYIDQGFGDPRKITEPTINGDKRLESFPTGQIPTGAHMDYSHLQEAEQQKLFFDNVRQPDYYSRNNIQDVIKRNNQNLDNRKDCAMSMSEQHYNVSRSKYPDAGKPPYETFYPKDFDKRPENPACFQRNENVKNENMNVHARLPRSALLFNDPRFADRAQHSFPYQSNPNAYRNYLRPEYSYQDLNSQDRFEYPGGFQRNEINEFRVPPQQTQSCEQFSPSQQIPGFLYEQSMCQQNPEKMQQFYLGKEPVQTNSIENRKPNFLEAIRSEDINKNGANKISPLRLLRKKKFINVPQEPAPVSTNVDAPPGLDVRKFWSTWADGEEENVAPTQMVVLDCQNIDPEQAKLLHLYETDPVRAVHLEAGNIVIKGVKELTGLSEEVQQTSENETKTDEQTNIQQDKTEKPDENNSHFVPESESKCIEPKTLKKVKSAKKNTEVMDKWTEKKFDFLKRAEESKAAEILRHEEEKKKIIETRLTLQQSLKKTEKPQEKNLLLDENSQSGTEDGNANATNLPTCEYRRNKFLDYSERNVIVNGKGKSLAKNEIEEEIKKEENIKVERSENPTDMLLNVKLKEETGFEMEDILKKISEINFEGSEIKFEEGDKNVRKSKNPKKKKTDQLEADKLTVETVTKPTIKFSIQKSHDLKISFKVLNSKEEGDEDPEDKGNALEDSKNSTEFTLRYKTFKRDADGRAISGLKKKRFRKKKRIPDMKTPILKIKKSRFMQREEKDPLADDDDEEEQKTFTDGYSNSDGFQVQETVDSAKIKLTFKRHKGNFETEYKINSNNAEKVKEEKKDLQEEEDDSEEVTKSSGGKATGIEIFQICPEQTSDGKIDSPTQKPEKYLINLSAPVEEIKSALPIFPEFPSEAPFEVETPENIFEETVKPGPIEEIEKHGQEQTVTDVNHVINCDEAIRSVSSSDGLDPNSKEEIEEISSDFIKSTKSPEIETNHKPGDSEIENCKIEIDCGLENSNGIKHGENSLELKIEDDEEKPKIIDNPDDETCLLDLISEEGVDVEEVKITENPSIDCLDDSIGNKEYKNSPLEIPCGLENSLEDLIRDDFSHQREKLKPETPEMFPTEILPQLSASQIEAEHEENSISTFDLGKVENSSPIENPESEIKSALVTTSEEAPKPETDSSILSETVSENRLGDVETTKCEPENKSEPVKSLLDDSCPTVEPNQLIDFLTNEIDEPELEDGEIIDSSDEDDKSQRKIEFIVRKIDRRHSISSRKRESQNLESWSRKKFLKAKSCPPELTFFESSTLITDVLVVNIPLPVGPPPLESCFNLEKYKSESEAKEKPKESIFPERVQVMKESESIFGPNDLEKCGNPSPSVAPLQLGILQRSSKIKFSFSKRSKFSKLTCPNSKFVDPPEVVESKSDDLDKKESVEPTPKECQAKEVPNVAKVTGNPKNDLESVELLCEDLEENVEVIDAMTDLIRNEFYECEDIPTSEDLTNGDELEIEKVNDDKFRNIMQNCLDNAKKFLNVGNLKLFSCSVDDLLELDCQPEPSFEDNEPEKPTSVRDVLLTSCGDTEDLGFSENMQPGDISDDFVPPFCSDICPEILPVDNWPYLEEEVISSPKLRQDETDLIPALDNLDCPAFGSVEKLGRKRVISESFRRASDDDFRICSNVGQRRKTIDGFTATSYRRDIRDFSKELILLKNEKENKSLKCRLSLKKLTDKHGIDFEFKNEKNQNGVLKKSKSLDYKSPSWQPKVMLFRISKNELRKLSRTKRQAHLNGEPPKTEISPKFDTETEPVVKKQKSEPEIKKLHVKPEEGSGRAINPTVALSDVERKHKKSRFRNLHTKRKPEIKLSTHQKEVVDPEIILTEIFKNCDVEKTKEKETGGSHEKSKEDSRREAKKDSRDKRCEERQKDRHREGESRKHSRHGSGHEKSRSAGRHEEEKGRSPRWVCEVCGFDEVDQRVVHIKNHPFHCQSCHLAFKTESHFISHLTKKHKDIRNQHHCLLCELSFDTEDQYQSHLDTREHKHLETVEKNTINTLFTLLTGAPCPVLGLVEAKPEWLPNQAGTVHFYHQATPLSLALQYLKMHRDLSSFSTTSSTHPT